MVKRDEWSCKMGLFWWVIKYKAELREYHHFVGTNNIKEEEKRLSDRYSWKQESSDVNSAFIY